jgi:hypothetical protein
VIDDPEKVTIPAMAAPPSALVLAVHYFEQAQDVDTVDGNTRRKTIIPDPQLFPNPQNATMPGDGLYVGLAKLSLDSTGNIVDKSISRPPDVFLASGPALPNRWVPLSKLSTTTLWDSDGHIALNDVLTIQLTSTTEARSQFFLVDIYPKTPGGELTWQWDISCGTDGRHVRTIVVTNKSTLPSGIDIHYKVYALQDI